MRRNLRTMFFRSESRTRYAGHHAMVLLTNAQESCVTLERRLGFPEIDQNGHGTFVTMGCCIRYLSVIVVCYRYESCGCVALVCVLKCH